MHFHYCITLQKNGAKLLFSGAKNVYLHHNKNSNTDERINTI